MIPCPEPGDAVIVRGDMHRVTEDDVEVGGVRIPTVVVGYRAGQTWRAFADLVWDAERRAWVER